MTIEEKVKAYDEAVERAKKELQTCGSTDCDAARQIFRLFPELKESKDEKIRKFLIKWIQDNYYHGTTEIPTKTLIDWLEKQKTIDVLDKEEKEFADNVDSYRKDMDEFYKKGYNAGREAEKQYWLEKQGKSDKIVEKAKIEKQRVLVTESDGSANIDWDTRSLEDARKLLEYGLQYINTELEKQGEQKPAWSEKDECYMSECIGAIATKDGWSFEEKRKTKHWLESLKQTIGWKPSDEQITVLELASKYERVFTPKQIDILIDLKEQLKKLRGE